MRAALHSHILLWMKPRKEPKDYSALLPIPRQAVGTEPRQRPRNQHVPPLDRKTYREDNCYHRAEFGRVWTEMVRPSTAGWGHGGFVDWEKLRVAGLSRAIQTRLYLHSCSHKYCLQNRRRAFFSPMGISPGHTMQPLMATALCGPRPIHECSLPNKIHFQFVPLLLSLPGATAAAIRPQL